MKRNIIITLAIALLFTVGCGSPKEKPIKPKEVNFINQEKVNLWCWEEGAYLYYWDFDKDGEVDALTKTEGGIISIQRGYENIPSGGMNKNTKLMTPEEREKLSYYKNVNENADFAIATQRY